METKIWEKEEIRQNLNTNDVWVTRGVCAIFNYQTAEEQSVDETVEDNGVGFNGVDANILSSFAKQINKWNAQTNPSFPCPLSPRQMEIARNKIGKYAGQLAKIANGEL